MANPTVPERLATLETPVATGQHDVSTSKTDVKLLLLSDARGAGILSFFGRLAPWIAICLALAAFIIPRA